MTRLALIALAAGLIVSGAQGQEPTADDDAAMKAKTRALGVSVGQTYACADEAGRAELEAEAHLLFDFIMKDVGSDLAWVFATSAGFGAAAEAATLDCPKLAQGWAKTRDDFGLAEEGE